MNAYRLQSETLPTTCCTIFFTFIAACAEAALTYCVYVEGLPAIPTLAAHLVFVAMLAAAYFTPSKSSGRRDGDVGLQLIILLAILVSGVLGAVGGLVLLLLIRSLPKQTALVDDWYNRLTGTEEVDHCTYLYQAIRNNRAHGRSAVQIGRFDGLIRYGHLADKQAVLGLIALNYHPEYRRILFYALRDSEPTVRVQAAAIFTKLQEDAKRELQALISDKKLPHDGYSGESSQASPKKTALRLLELIDGGFLDVTETTLARRQLVELACTAPDMPFLYAEALKTQAGSRQKDECRDHATDRLEKLASAGDNEAQALYAEHLLTTKSYARLRSFLTFRRQLCNSTQRAGG